MRQIKTGLLLAAFAALFSIGVGGCKKDPDIESSARRTGPYVPKGWPQPNYTFTQNVFSPEGFALGKKLFYDPRLSKGNAVSCGSCHQINSAFAHTDHTVSHGVEDRLGTRNSPPLFNLAWHPLLMWDGGVKNLEQQPASPIVNHVEMDETLPNVVAKIAADSAYRAAFLQAYGTEQVNTQRIFRAITQFVGTMVSDKSRYDKWIRGESGGDMSVKELAGLSLYQQHCATCHAGPLFTDFTFRNNGLPQTAVNDSGRMLMTGEGEDLYKFKVASLRNLKYSAPYMHDGRFRTLDAVLDHYSAGVRQSSTLDPRLKDGIRLTAAERENLLAFLGTLNDEEFVKDKRFAE